MIRSILALSFVLASGCAQEPIFEVLCYSTRCPSTAYVADVILATDDARADHNSLFDETLTVEWYPSDFDLDRLEWFPHEKPEGNRLLGLTRGTQLIRTTSTYTLLHELVHLAAARFEGNPDGDHSDARLWRDQFDASVGAVRDLGSVKIECNAAQTVCNEVY